MTMTLSWKTKLGVSLSVVWMLLCFSVCNIMAIALGWFIVIGVLPVIGAWTGWWTWGSLKKEHPPIYTSTLEYCRKIESVCLACSKIIIMLALFYLLLGLMLTFYDCDMWYAAPPRRDLFDKVADEQALKKYSEKEVGKAIVLPSGIQVKRVDYNGLVVLNNKYLNEFEIYEDMPGGEDAELKIERVIRFEIVSFPITFRRVIHAPYNSLKSILEARRIGGTQHFHYSE